MPTFNQVQMALENCIKAEPTIDYQLSRDASQLGSVIGLMIHFKETERPLESFTSTQQAVFKRWESQ
jgi:hypothetical protein